MKSKPKNTSHVKKQQRRNEKGFVGKQYKIKIGGKVHLDLKFWSSWPAMFCGLVIFIKNNTFNIWRLWVSETTMFCSEVMMIKIFNFIIHGGLGHPFRFYIFSNKFFLFFDHFLFTPGCYPFHWCSFCLHM